MHSKDVRSAGESEQRVYRLSAWRGTPFYTEAERAALAFAVAVTLMAEDHVPTAGFDAWPAHDRPDEIGALLSLVVTINACNAVGVSTRTRGIPACTPRATGDRPQLGAGSLPAPVLTLAAAQSTCSLGDGAYYVTSILFFTTVVDLNPAHVGLGLSVF